MTTRIIIGLFAFLLINFASIAQDSTAAKTGAAIKAKTDVKKTTKKAKGGNGEESTKTAKPKLVPKKVSGPLKVGVKIVPGYRLQVLTTTDRKAALAMKAKTYGLFPYDQVYMQIKLPYYSVHIGNYLTKDMAKKMKVKVANTLKTSVYIIGADIAVRYYPQLEPPPSNSSTTKKKSSIFSYGGGKGEIELGPDGKPLKRKKKKGTGTKKKAAAPGATPSAAPDPLNIRN
jgi:hypothetical protein